jgi:hypothetical protein
VGVEWSCVAIGDGRMAASRAGVMVASMAACGLRELDDEVDESDRAASELRGELWARWNSNWEVTLRVKRQAGTRGAHERYRSHQAGDREMIRNDAIVFMGPTPMSVLFQTIILEVLKNELT